VLSDSGFFANTNTRPSSTSVISGRGFGVAASFPLGSQRTSLRVGTSELVADDVASLVGRVFVMSRVLVVAEIRYKHSHCAQTADVSRNYRRKYN